MDGFCLPPSPNWYCSHILDSNDSGLIAFGSRHCIVLLKCHDLARSLPTMAGCLAVHKERLSGLSFCFFEGHVDLIASVGDDGAVMLTDVANETSTMLHEMHKAPLTCVSWARLHDRAIYAVSGDGSGTVIAVNIASNKAKVFNVGRSSIKDLAGCPQNGKLVAVGFQDGLIIVMDLDQNGSATCQLRHHDGDIQSLCWAPFSGFGPFAASENDGKDDYLLASGSRDQTVRIWSTLKGVPLAKLSIPSHVGDPPRKSKEDKRNVVWITVAWPKRHPFILLTNCVSSGGLLQWHLNDLVAKKPWYMVKPKSKPHSRVVFNICTVGEVALTCSMDRQIIFWNFLSADDKLLANLAALPTLGGFVYKLAFSPVNSGILAIGCGDNLIRTWNVSSAKDAYDVSVLWQGVKTKVTALAWHPRKEGILAFGTEEGRVGFYNILSNKPPTIFASFHHKMVYTVCWGPPCPSKEWDIESQQFYLYSCDDRDVNIHDPLKAYHTAESLEYLLKHTPQAITKHNFHTEVVWSPKFDFLTLGGRDGKVEIYRASDLNLIVIITTYHKLVQCLQWHPLYTMTSTDESKYSCFLAIGGQDSDVHIHDLRPHLEADNAGNVSSPASVESLEFRLVGHCAPVSAVTWNRHFDMRLATASFDSTIRVWDVLTRTTIAVFCGHSERILCAEWSATDPDMVYSGGEDFTLKVWRVSAQTAELSDKALATVAKLKKKYVKKPKSSKKSLATRNENAADLASVETSNDGRQLNSKADDDGKEVNVVAEVGEADDVECLKASVSLAPSVVIVPSSKKKKKKAYKAILPLTSALENRGKEFALDDCVALADKLAGIPLKDDAQDAHLGLYGNRIDAYKLLKIEGDNHKSTDNLDYALQLEIWKGNVAGALQMAAEREQLTDWLVSLAVTVSPSMWTDMCIQYARQLVAAGQPLHAVLYLLAAQRVHEAIDVLKMHVSYRDAIALAKVRLPPNDPVTIRLMEEWGEYFDAHGYSERAALCYLSCNAASKATEILAKRSDPKSLYAASHVAKRLGDEQQAATYAQKGIYKSLVEKDYSTARNMIEVHPDLKPYSVILEVHELLGAGSFADDRETFLDVAKRLAADTNGEFHDCLNKTVAVLPSPCAEPEIVAWLSVILTKAAVAASTEFWDVVLRAFTTVQRTAISHWFCRVAALFGVERLDGCTSEVMAYACLSRVQQMTGNGVRIDGGEQVDDSCPKASPSCSEAFRLLTSAAPVLLDESRAKHVHLRQRTMYTRVALASSVARQKYGKQVDDTAEESAVVLSDVPADKLIEFPGISEAILQAECLRLESQLSEQPQSLDTSFPDPFESAIHLAELVVRYVGFCKCQNWKEELDAIVDFGRKWAVVQRQFDKIDAYKGMAIAPVIEGEQADSGNVFTGRDTSPPITLEN